MIGPTPLRAPTDLPMPGRRSGTAPPTPRLSPLNRRRLRNFRANRRGHWAFWIFLVLFVLTLLANSSPTTGRS